jgi:RNA polymerase sigma-70 factor (ECF subfamily)
LLQSIYLVLWRKFESFQPGSNFLYWASRTAKLVVSDFLKRKRLPSYASDELLDTMVETMSDVPSTGPERHLEALRRCRAKLSSADGELIDMHYADELGSRQIADELHRSQPSICNSLNRIRSWLFRCVQIELSQQQHSGEPRS